MSNNDKPIKIAVLSDTHYGYDHRTHRIHEKFLKKLSDSCDQEGVDLVIHCGDWIANNQHQLPRTWKMFRDSLGDIPILGVTGNHDCLDKETELLTKEGWVTFDKIKKSDYILSINDSGFSEWSHINEIIIKKSDKIFTLKNKNIDMAVTEKHRIMHKKRVNSRTGYYGELTYSNIKDIAKGRYSFPLSRQNSNPDFPISDDQIKLLAWILTDGSFGKGCQIWQSKKENIIVIKKLLDDLKMEYTFLSRDRNITHICGKKLVNPPLPQGMFYIHSKSLNFIKDWLSAGKILKNSNKFNLFSNRQLILFIKTLIDGDGSYVSTGTGCSAVLHGKKEFLDWVQSLTLQCGIRSFIVEYRKKTYRLNIAFEKDSVDLENPGKITEEKDYNDFVWCLAVPYTNFAVRRNGKAYFTGNCWDQEFWNNGFKSKFARHPAGMSLPAMEIQHKDWATEFKIHLLEQKPYRFKDTIIYGFNGWYGNVNPPTNDAANMAKMYETAPTHAYFNYRAGKELDWIFQDIERLSGELKKVCVTHFPPYTKKPEYEVYCANQSYLPFITEKFDLLLVGHSHQQEDWFPDGSKCRVVNPGTQFDDASGGYNKPNFKIVEI